MEKERDKHPVVKLILLQRKHFFQKITFLILKMIFFLKKNLFCDLRRSFFLKNADNFIKKDLLH